MPDCPNCATWNPDDKLVCWRCQAELPRPQAKQQRKPLRILGLPSWLFLALIFFVVMMLAGRCFTTGLTSLGG